MANFFDYQPGQTPKTSQSATPEQVWLYCFVALSLTALVWLQRRPERGTVNSRSLGQDVVTPDIRPPTTPPATPLRLIDPMASSEPVSSADAESVPPPPPASFPRSSSQGSLVSRRAAAQSADPRSSIPASAVPQPPALRLSSLQPLAPQTSTSHASASRPLYRGPPHPWPPPSMPPPPLPVAQESAITHITLSSSGVRNEDGAAGES